MGTSFVRSAIKMSDTDKERKMKVDEDHDDEGLQPGGVVVQKRARAET